MRGTILFREVGSFADQIFYESNANKLTLQGLRDGDNITWTLTSISGDVEQYDANGLLVAHRDHNGVGLEMLWEPDSSTEEWRLLSVIDTVGREIAYEYNAQDRIVRVSEPTSGLEALYEYDANGNLVAATDSRARSETYEYDHDDARTAGYWAAEQQLTQVCEQVCAPSSTSCDAGGACDEPVREAWYSCYENCGNCASNCNEQVCGTCATNCAAGVLGQPGCNAGCSAECNGPMGESMAESECYQLWNQEYEQACQGQESAVCEAYGGSCDVFGTINLMCFIDGPCLGGLANSHFWANKDSYTKFLEMLVVGGIWGGVCLGHEIVCLGGWLCDTSETCGDDTPRQIPGELCQNNTALCCRDGERCGEDSCNSGQTFMQHCEQIFLGRQADEASTCTTKGHASMVDGSPIPEGELWDDWGVLNGCIPELRDSCPNRCGQQCLNECEPDCLAACGSACDDECMVGECAPYCSGLGLQESCEEGCVEGCIDESHERSDGAKFGHATDLNHNIVRIRDGDGNVYLENTYGTDVDKPNFDSVVVQEFGEYPVEFYYRDLAAEQRGDIDPPTSGPAAQFIDGASFVPIDICPAAMTDQLTLPATTFVPFQDLLFGFDGEVASLPVVRMRRSNRHVAPTILQLTAKGDGVFARATSEQQGPHLRGRRSSGFDVKLSSGTVRFRPRGKQSFVVTGTQVAINELLALQELTLMADSGNGIVVYPGHPITIAHVASGGCKQPFVAQDHGELVDISPATACDDSLLVSPLASAVEEQGYKTLWVQGQQMIGTDMFRNMQLFRPSALVAERTALSLRRDGATSTTYSRRTSSSSVTAVGTRGAIINTQRNLPLMAQPGENGNYDGPLYIFHDASSGPRYGIPDPFGDLTFPLDAITDFVEVGGSVGELPATARVVIDYHGVAWTYYFNKQGRRIQSVNNGTGAVHSYNYDAAGKLVGHKDPLGGRTCLTLNQSGNVLEQVSYPIPSAQGESEPIRWRYSYVPDTDRLRLVFDPRSGSSSLAPTDILTTMNWSDAGNLNSVTDASGDTTTFALVGGTGPDRGNVFSATTSDGVTNEVVYDMQTAKIERATFAAGSGNPVVHVSGFDSAGHVLSHLSPMGENTLYEWDDNRLQSIAQNADGLIRQHVFSYTSSGQLAQVVRGDRATTMSYDLTGNLRSVMHTPANAAVAAAAECFEYAPDGRLLESVNAEGSRVAYTYNAEGQRTEAYAGSWTSTGSWDDACPSSFTSGVAATGTIERNEYDLNGRLVRTINAMGVATEFEYDGFGRVILQRLGDSSEQHQGYDRLGNVIWQASYDIGGAPFYAQPSWGAGNLLAATELEYDSMGRLTQSRSQHFDTTGNSIGDGWSTTSITYEPSQRSVSVTNDNGNVTTSTYDEVGRLVQQILADGSSTTRSFSDGGRTVSETISAPTASGAITKTTYLSAFGAPLAIVSSDAGPIVTFMTNSYDAHRRLTMTTSVSGASTQYTYDALDRIVSLSKDMGDGSKEEVNYRWDRNRLLTSMQSKPTDGLAATSTFDYDALGRRVRTVGPDGSETSTIYHLASHAPGSILDPLGVLSAFSYDGVGQVAQVRTSHDTLPTQARGYDYDGLGRLVYAVQFGDLPNWAPANIETYREWDSLGNLSGEYNSLVQDDIDHEYDGIGNQVASSYGSRSITRSFDALGRLVRLWADGSDTPAVQLSYQGLGGPTELDYGDRQKTQYGYDAFGRLTDLELRNTSTGRLLAQQHWAIPADGVPRVQYDYRHEIGENSSVYQIDIRGRVVSETHNLTGLGSLSTPASQTTAAANQVAAPYLVKGEWSTYDLDGRGNWVELTTAKTSYGNSLGVADEYTSFAGESLSYDDRGSVVKRGAESYSWDSFGELTRFKDGADSYEFVRDALGRVVGERDANGDQTWYGYDGVHKAVRWQPGADTDYTIGGQGVDEHYLRLGQIGQDPTYYYHQDRMGSVFGLSRQASPGDDAQVVEWAQYTAFGEATLRSPGGDVLQDTKWANAFGFQGHRQDHRIGLVDMRARHYRPSLGRFLRRDPIGLAGGNNQLAFVGSAPLKYTDPSGLMQNHQDWFRANAGPNYAAMKRAGFPSWVAQSVLPPGMSVSAAPGHFSGAPSGGAFATVADWAIATDNDYRVSVRSEGAGQAVVGGTGMVVGAALCETGIGCVVGAPLVAASADYGGAGLSALGTGEHADTLVHQTADALGYDGAQAEAYQGMVVAMAGIAHAGVAVAGGLRAAWVGAKPGQVNLANPARSRHILQGDGTGGGHKFGLSRLFNGKSKFPATWSEGRIMNAVSEVATSRTSTWVQQTGRAGAELTRRGVPVKWKIDGVFDGVDIRVIVQGNDIITAFPIR